MRHQMFIPLILSAALAFLSPCPVLAGEQGEVEVNIDGRTIEFTGTAPFIDGQGRTQVPARAMAEALDCTVDWKEKGQMVSIRGKGRQVEFRIGEDWAIVKDDLATSGVERLEMDTSAMLLERGGFGVTFVPARFLANALGAWIEWNADKRMVVIRSSGTSKEPPIEEDVPEAGGDEGNGRPEEEPVYNTENEPFYKPEKEPVFEPANGPDPGTALVRYVRITPEEALQMPEVGELLKLPHVMTVAGSPDDAYRTSRIQVIYGLPNPKNGSSINGILSVDILKEPFWVTYELGKYDETTMEILKQSLRIIYPELQSLQDQLYALMMEGRGVSGFRHLNLGEGYEAYIKSTLPINDEGPWGREAFNIWCQIVKR